MWSTGLGSEMQPTLPEISTLQLADLFKQNMDLSHDNNQGAGQTIPLAVTVEHIEPLQPAIKYSVSQHYTHSAHVVQNLHPLQPSNDNTASRMLIKHGIAPSSLLRAQLTLFEHADEDQRLRLIQLWTILPPTYARNGGQDLADKLGEYQTTTLAQEEDMAMLMHQTSGAGGDMKNGVEFAQPEERKPAPPVDFFMRSSSEGLHRAINQYFPATAPGQSLEGNGSWSQDLNQQQMEHQYGNFQRYQGGSQEVEMEDEEML